MGWWSTRTSSSPKVAFLSLQISSSWDEAIDNDLVFFMSVDGTHCPIEEPRPFSTEWSSFKLGG
jgi:hypothetical protein